MRQNRLTAPVGAGKVTLDNPAHGAYGSLTTAIHNRAFNQTMITPEQFALLLPHAGAWAMQQELIILRDGVPLLPEQIHDAISIGVLHPAKVRLLCVEQIPMPDDARLRAAAEETNLISPNTIGLTLRYGIFIRADCWQDRKLVRHELVHTAQYERLGGIQQFLQRYLHECISIGYPEAPMEQEAIQTAARLCS